MIMSSLAFSQRVYEFPRMRLGIEAGLENSFGANEKPSNIRESQPYFRYDYEDFYYDCGFMVNQLVFTKYYFGFKPEYSLNLKFAVSSGIRFSFAKSELTADRSYYLWKIEESHNNTNYLRIKSMSQNVYNISIPAEIKFFPHKSDIFGRVYTKLATVINFTFANDVSVVFSNIKMEKYLPEIKKEFKNPSLFYGQIIPAVGVKIGRMKYPFGCLELQIPIHFSEKTRLSSLFKLESVIGVGVKTTLYIPYGNDKLSYNY